nr:hypothetical protein [Nitrosomonas nitrosa]
MSSFAVFTVLAMGSKYNHPERNCLIANTMKRIGAISNKLQSNVFCRHDGIENKLKNVSSKPKLHFFAGLLHRGCPGTARVARVRWVELNFSII